MLVSGKKSNIPAKNIFTPNNRITRNADLSSDGYFNNKELKYFATNLIANIPKNTAAQTT